MGFPKLGSPGKRIKQGLPEREGITESDVCATEADSGDSRLHVPSSQLFVHLSGHSSVGGDEAVGGLSCVLVHGVLCPPPLGAETSPPGP